MHLDLRDAEELTRAYRYLAGRCGPRVLLAPMVGPGVEMILGAKRDPQFGPIVLLGFGGVQAELLGDVAFALPPFTADWAERCLAGLKLRPLLGGVRGAPPASVAAFCNAASRFSAIVHALRDSIAEIDINPLIVDTQRCVAVDALLVGYNGRQAT